MAPFTATRLDLRGAGDGLTRVALPARDSWFLMLYLAPAMHADILAGGARLPLRTYPAGSICLVDLRRGAAIAIRGRLQALALGLPRDLLAEIADMGAGPGRPRPTGLRCLRGVPDPVIASLSRALLPLFDAPDLPGPLLRHLAVAICAHLLHSYRADGPGGAGGRGR
ncbi:hypothetical protein [Marinibacterium sp. SX1]|uniref:hypothetical protein n=1 Tax=Marinibacterium sp. SX1 TaxID=3388424 RepID=UPI003D1675EC